MTPFRPGQGYPAPRITEEALRAIKLPSGPAPGATTRPDPSTEKRVVLVKPGDVLLIGGAHPWQEYNAHGNTCHYPGCRMIEDEHEATP